MEFVDTSKFMGREFAHLICGRLIGEGIARKVYNNRLDASTVIKVESGGNDFHNIYEWHIWEKFKEVEGIKEWLAPCVAISPNGAVMIQKKAELVRWTEVKGMKMPSFMQDFKPENFGMIDGHIVCVDYAGATISLGSKLVKADWWQL